MKARAGRKERERSIEETDGRRDVARGRSAATRRGKAAARLDAEHATVASYCGACGMHAVLCTASPAGSRN